MEANQALMGQVQNELDSVLTNTMTIYMDISNNAAVRTIEQETNPNQYLIYQLIQEIELYQYLIPKVQEIRLYFRDQDIIVSKKGNYTAKEYYDAYYSDSDLSFETWKQRLEGSEGRWQEVRTEAGNPREVLYFNKLAGNSGVRENVVFVSSLPQTIFADQMEKLRYAEQGNLMVCTDDGQQMYANHSMENAVSKDVLHQNITERQGSAKLTGSDGQKYIMTYAKSNVLNWNYIYVLPNRVLMSKVNHTRSIVMWVTVCSIVFGMLLILYLIKRQYKPVKKLMRLVQTEDGDTTMAGYNEFDYLEDVIKSEKKGRERIESELKQHKQVVRMSYLSKLLRGKVQDKYAFREILDMLEIPCDNSQYAVLLFDVKDYTKLFETDTDLTNERRVELANFILTNIVEELVDEAYNGVMFECEDNMVCLVTAGEEDDGQLDDRLEDIANHAVDLVKQNFHLECNVGISQVYTTCMEIPQAYQESVETLEYTAASGENGVQRYDRFLAGATGTVKFSAEDRQQFIASLKTFREAQIMETAEEIIGQNEPQLEEDPQVLRGVLFEFVSVLIHASDEIDAAGLLSSRILDIEAIRSLLECTTAAQLRERIRYIARAIEAMDPTHLSGDDILIKVWDYIMSHYKDDTLNVAQIGTEFHMTPHYLSKMFKQKYGIGMLEYINKIRVEQAKSILQTGNKTLENVAKEVGFTNTVTFIRVFKKYVGMTPGKYREVK